MEMESDHKLVERSRHGDEEAFGELMSIYYQRTYALAYQIVNHHEDARDLAQQAWIKAWKSMPRFRGGSRFFTWIYRITVSTCLDHMRRRKRRPETLIDDLPLFAASVHTASANSAKTSELETKIAELLPDEMTPREALSALYEIKSILKSGPDSR